jgi:hypothetical protein
MPAKNSKYPSKYRESFFIRRLGILEELPAKLIDCYTDSVDNIKRTAF